MSVKDLQSHFKVTFFKNKSKMYENSYDFTYISQNLYISVIV